MKKMFLLAAVALLVCGTVWSQINLPRIDWMYADTAESTESATSAGIFGSDIDDYIDVNGYDPSVNTFLFLGGNTAVGANNISLGFGKALDAGYLSLYYGGGIVDASGNYVDGTKTTNSTAAWNNNIVAMFGLQDSLSFRLDVHFSPDASKTDVDGDIITEAISADTRIAFTLGGFSLGSLTSYASIGFDFPASSTTPTDTDGDTVPDENITELSTSVLGLQFGISAESGFYADALVDIGLPSSFDGDIADPSDGRLGIGLQAGYGKTFEMGKFAFGFKPEVEMYLGLPDEAVKQTDFALLADIDLGIRFTINEKFALYSGAVIQFFSFDVESTEDENDWGFYGITSGSLDLGLTFAPVQNVVIGANLSTFFGSLFGVDLGTLTVDGGPALTASDDFLSYVFSNLDLALTVSVKL